VPALAAEWTLDEGQLVEQPKPYSPYVDQHFPKRVFFGDTHHHSSLSVDSGLIGNRHGPDVGFRFARGEEMRTSHGQRVKDLLNTADPALMATEAGKKWYAAMKAGGEAGWDATIEISNEIASGKPSFRDTKVERNVWEHVVDTASKYNEPGKFTAFNGWEYTPAPGGNNLHRVVILRDGPDRAKQIIPFSGFDSPDPEDLWAWMAEYEKKTGGQILAIPHNPNLSNGVMFAETVNGQRMTRDYAERRARWEPLLEVTQMKGDSEAHPILSPEDEFADYETWDVGNLGGVPKEEKMLQYEYARSALRQGLKLDDRLGVNPFKFGMIGSSDTHTSLSTVREDNFFGKLPHYEPSDTRYQEMILRNIQTGDGLGAGRGLGAGEHPGIALRRHGTQGSLRHQRVTHHCAGIRWLGF
jgi:hypothetical protein